MYNVTLTRQAVKDAQKLERAALKPKAAALIKIIRQNPFQNPPPYEKLQGYDDTFSRRINIQHRLIYQILPNQHDTQDNTGKPYQGIVKIIRMWTHYE
jgi:Txe/YoeB family toxin of toxin-antitoxin system